MRLPLPGNIAVSAHSQQDLHRVLVNELHVDCQSETFQCTPGQLTVFATSGIEGHLSHRAYHRAPRICSRNCDWQFRTCVQDRLMNSRYTILGEIVGCLPGWQGLRLLPRKDVINGKHRLQEFHCSQRHKSMERAKQFHGLLTRLVRLLER